MRGLTILFLAAVAGCANPERLSPVPLELTTQSVIYDIPDARFLADTGSKALFAKSVAWMEKDRARAPKGPLPPEHFLALSGGGDDGAFGAGLLVGWGERGDRPEFKVVTGVSTGALAAPFVFLGRDYDPALRAVYTKIGADDVFLARPFLAAALADDALSDTTPLYHTISKYLDKRMVARIGEEYARGRLLFIMTTNLDAGRPVVWNLGAIAASNHPKARELILRILLASAAVPGAFPPVMIDVSVNGKRYQEMHVDGGTVAQMFLYPPSINLKRASAAARVDRKRVAYLIRNGRIKSQHSSVERKTFSIASRAISTMIASSGVNDAYRIYAITQRDGVGFNLAFVDEDFAEPYRGPFDKGYMNKLFAYGYEKGKSGYRWLSRPPDYAE